jgi:hypothetical protein
MRAFLSHGGQMQNIVPDSKNDFRDEFRDILQGLSGKYPNIPICGYVATERHEM